MERVQDSGNDCGAACVWSILAFNGMRADYGEIKRSCGVGERGASLRRLHEVILEHGLSAKVLGAVASELPFANYDGGPMIVPLVAGGPSMSHFLVVFASRSGAVLAMDPAVGLRWIEAPEFIANVRRVPIGVEIGAAASRREACLTREGNCVAEGGAAAMNPMAAGGDNNNEHLAEDRIRYVEFLSRVGALGWFGGGNHVLTISLDGRGFALPACFDSLDGVSKSESGAVAVRALIVKTDAGRTAVCSAFCTWRAALARLRARRYLIGAFGGYWSARFAMEAASGISATGSACVASVLLANVAVPFAHTTSLVGLSLLGGACVVCASSLAAYAHMSSHASLTAQMRAGSVRSLEFCSRRLLELEVPAAFLVRDQDVVRVLGLATQAVPALVMAVMAALAPVAAILLLQPHLVVGLLAIWAGKLMGARLVDACHAAMRRAYVVTDGQQRRDQFEGLSAAHAVRLHGLQSLLARHLRQSTRAFISVNGAQLRFSGGVEFAEAVIDTLALAVFAVAIFGAVASGTLTLQSGALVIALVLQGQRVAMDIRSQLLGIRDFSIVHERLAAGPRMVFEAFDSQNEASALVSLRHTELEWSTISMEGLSVKRVGRGEVVRAPAIVFRAGAHICVYGESGAGKTSLSLALAGFLKMALSALTVDDAPVQRSAIGRLGVVLAEPRGLAGDGTIRDNVLFDRCDISEGQYRTAIVASGLSAILEALPGGDEAVIGGSGHKLSDGQLKRLCLARALLAGPRMLLLDELLSAMEYGARRTILEHLRKEYPRMTVLATAHDRRDRDLYHEVWHLNEGILSVERVDRS